MEPVEKIAEAVLYEGYLLYPYRRSAMKNQLRWTFGGVYPRAYSEASGADDPWSMQTQCLVVGNAGTELQVKVRFLHVVDRKVSERLASGERFVEELRVGERIYRPWEEATERETLIGGQHAEPRLLLGDLIDQPRKVEIEVAAGSAAEPLIDPAGAAVGSLIREWQSLHGAIEIGAEPLERSREGDHSRRKCCRLTVRIVNITPWMQPNQRSDMQTGGATGRAPIRQTFISTHTIMRVDGGEFVSLLEPPAEYRAAAEGCANVNTWPVLCGSQGDQHTLLSSPIILYDYPQIAPESPGNLFDATEIDELLTLSIMTLTDAEKQEMRASDARGREILERTESLSPEQIIKLHGAIRSLQPRKGADR